ncbi:MAG: tRNA lysidine(34) synthetase TilS [Bacteroidales bacterium]|nr:tRNA lysidine(34) synthetase TilS [Bacteroidales bacterium]
MLNSFIQYCKKFNLISEQDRILIGVSGGVDSCVLLDLFSKTDAKIEVAHCNFNLRGNESDQDETFVRERAEHYMTKIYVKHFATTEYAAKNKISIEMAARELRYNWFEEIMKTENFQTLAVGHNKNDQVETMLINMTRGSGIRGLTGMKPKSNYIIRPLLFASRVQIEQYAQTNKLNYRTDSSNNTDVYLRNKIRHHIIPLFTELNPNFLNTIEKNIEKLTDVFEVYKQKINDEIVRIVVTDNNTTTVSLNELRKLTPIKPYLYEILNNFNFNESVIDDILNIKQEETDKTFLSKTHRLLLNRDFLIIIPISIQSNITNTLINIDTTQIEQPIKLNIKKSKKREAIFFDSKSIHIDLEHITFPLEVRKWQDGDAMKPYGMNGKKKKISDILTDLKINNFKKEEVYVLVCKTEILWLIGYRTSEIGKITENTKSYITISLE